MSVRDALLVGACVLGGTYGYLGLKAGQHLQSEADRKSPSKRLILTSVAWSMASGDEFTEQGKRLCRLGNWVWIAWLVTTVVWWQWK